MSDGKWIDSARVSICLSPELIREIGSPKAAILYGQLSYWCERGINDWTNTRLSEVTGLTIQEIRYWKQKLVDSEWISTAQPFHFDRTTRYTIIKLPHSRLSAVPSAVNRDSEVRSTAILPIREDREIRSIDSTPSTDLSPEEEQDLLEYLREVKSYSTQAPKILADYEAGEPWVKSAKTLMDTYYPEELIQERLMNV